MNKLYKEQWVKALRSGKYKQAYGRMEELKANCAIMVLNLCTGNKLAVLQIPILERGKIMDFNDLEHLSFSKIANYIEANL